MSHTKRVRRLVVTAVVSLSLAVAAGAPAGEIPAGRAGNGTQPSIVVRVRDGGFHWADAGVGAAAALAATLVGVGLAIALRPDRRTPISRHALSSAPKEER